MSGFKDFLKENAVAGSIGAGSIAANPSNDSNPRRREHKHAEHDWRSNAPKEREEEKKYADMREKIKRAKEAKEKQKKRSFKDFFFRRNTNESLDVNDIVSRLKASDVATTGNDIGVVSYGVEDDKGNVMRITVRSDQAKEFEETIARQLADNKDNKKNGINLQGNSLAEILYNLRDRFEIITVEFPQIPTDVVYNADQASKAPAGEFTDDDSDFESGFDNFDQGNPPLDQNSGDQGQTQDQGGLGGGDDDFQDVDNNSLETGDQDAGGFNPNGDQGQGQDDLGGGQDLGNEEGDNVEDFGDEMPEEEGGEESILKSIIGMLKAQANAQEAQAEAAAEEARAKQAEWSAIAADKSVKQQEDLARVEAEMEAQKKKEKEAKKYADIARYNIGKANGGYNESKSFLLGALKLLSEDQFDNVQTLQKQKLELQVKYQIQPNDDVETQNYKKMMYQYDLDQLNARIKAAQLNQQHQVDQAKNQQNQNQNQNQQNQNGQQQQNPLQPNSQIPAAPNANPQGAQPQ
jgi:hypothetical protein